MLESFQLELLDLYGQKLANHAEKLLEILANTISIKVRKWQKRSLKSDLIHCATDHRPKNIPRIKKEFAASFVAQRFEMFLMISDHFELDASVPTSYLSSRQARGRQPSHYRHWARKIQNLYLPRNHFHRSHRISKPTGKLKMKMSFWETPCNYKKDERWEQKKRKCWSVSHYFFNYRSPSWRLIAIPLPKASGTLPDSTIMKGMSNFL